MKMRFSRGISIAVALGMALTGGTALAAGTSHAKAGVTWKEGAKFPSTATRFDGALVGTKVYFLGFRVDDTGTTDGSIWYYDTKSKKFTNTKQKMPIPISNYSIAVLKDKTGVGLYTFGGRDANGKIIKNVQVYYPSKNKAMEVKSDPWPGTTPSKCVSLPGTGVAVVKNTAYVLGGMSFSTSVPACQDDNSKQTWSFDPMGKAGKRWKAGPNLNQARGYVTTAIVGGNTIYAIGGDVNDAATLTAQKTVESWKVGAKKWDDKGTGDLTEACDESQAFGFDSGPLAGTITLAGCGQWPNALADVQTYTVKTNKWAKTGKMKEARRNQAGESIGTAAKPNMMIVGGYNLDGTAILDTSEFGTVGKFAARGAVSTAHSAKGTWAVSKF